MADRVKGITVVLGGDTTGLNKALVGTNKEIKNTQSQLKDVERLLKLDPTNTQLLEQRQRLLADAVSETKTKLDTLKEAEKQVQAQFERGEISRQQYDALQREIADTEISLKNLTKRANDADGAIGGIDEKPLRDVEKAAENADEALEDAGKEASALGDYLKAGAIIEGAKGLADAMGGIVDDAKEYQQIMGTLKTSSEAAGYSTQETEQSFKQLQGVLGDSQASATTLANLQAIGLSQKDLTAMIENSIGAWAKYGDSIPIDGLAESINETIKAGQVTGTFADVLNWGSKEGETFGVKLKANTKTNEEWNKAVSEAKTAEDFFNLALQDAGTEAERADLIMQAMADQGLSKSSEAWRENNEELVANNEANDEYQSSMAELSQTVMPILTEITKATTEIVNFILSHQEAIVAALLAIGAGIVAMKLVSLIGTLSSIASGATTAAAAFPKLATAIGTLTNPVFLVTAAIVGLVALIATKGDEIQAVLQKVDDFLQNVFVTDWTQIFGPGIGDILNAFFANVKNIWDAIKKIFDGVIDFIRGVFTGDWERAWKGVQEIFGGIFDGLIAIAKAPLNGIIGLLNMAINGINELIKGFNGIGFDMPDWLGGGSWHPNIPTIPNIPYLAKGGTVLSGSAIVGEAGPELLTVGPGGTRVRPLTGNATNTTNLGGVSITVYGAPGQNVNELANIIMDKIEFATTRKGAVFGA